MDWIQLVPSYLVKNMEQNSSPICFIASKNKVAMCALRGCGSVDSTSLVNKVGSIKVISV